MKNIFGLLILTISFSCNIYSQDSLLVKVHFKTRHKYISTIQQKSSSKIKYDGSEDFLKSLKAKGEKNPSYTETEQTIQTITTTGDLNDKNIFPVVIEFTKVPTNNGKDVIPLGTKIYGKYIEKLECDSIASSNLSEEFKKSIIQSMQSLMSQIKFPEKKIKIGEDFKIENPISMTIAGLKLEMTIVTTYKLIKLENNLANFDIIINYTLNTFETRYKTTAHGSGYGKLTYDISNEFYNQYETQTDLNLKLKTEDMTIEIKSKNELIQSTEIAKW